MMLRKIFGQLAGRILAGPFSGMRYGGAAHGSPFAPKIFGVYESEIFPFIEEFARRGIRTFIDVGSAEGYFACGWAWRHQNARVYSFEIDEAARREQSMNVERNGLQERIQVRSACDTVALQEVVNETREGGEQAWMLCDIDGGEYDLLEGPFLSLLREIPVIVEIHDFVRPDLGEVIAQRFGATHRVTRVEYRHKTTADVQSALLRFLATLLFMRNPRLLDDGRPPGNYWLILEPKDS